MTSTPHRLRVTYLMLGGLVCADVSSYLFEKIACNRAAGDGLDGVAFLAAMLWQPFFWAAMGVGLIQLFLWTRILERMDLSVAYPISGLAMPMTLVAATLLLGERLSWPVWTGAVLITLGGAIIGPGQARSGESEPAYHPPVTPPG